jgi:hypothetical protein
MDSGWYKKTHNSDNINKNNASNVYLVVVQCIIHTKAAEIRFSAHSSHVEKKGIHYVI